MLDITAYPSCHSRWTAQCGYPQLRWRAQSSSWNGMGHGKQPWPGERHGRGRGWYPWGSDQKTIQEQCLRFPGVTLVFSRVLFYLHDPLDVPMAFSEVNTAEFGSTFSVLDVGFEYRPRTFSLSPDHTSHGVLKQSSLRQLPGWHVDTRFDSRSYKLPNRKLHFSF